MTSNDPSTVQLDDVKAALRGLGIETDHTMSVTIEHRRITVVRERLNDDGNRFSAGRDKIATVTTEIGVIS